MSKVRVKVKDLEDQVEELGSLHLTSPYYKLHWAYGGVKLLVRQPSGWNDVFKAGYMTKRDLSNRITAYRLGMEV